MLNISFRASKHVFAFHFSFTGDVDEAIRLFRNAIQVFKDSNCTNTSIDDRAVERIRIDLAELLQDVGR